jgi:hypothetical protein
MAGEMEHGGAFVHPMLGKAMRAVIGDGKAVIGSNVWGSGCGCLALRAARAQRRFMVLPAFRHDHCRGGLGAN